jgi:hypothetical protein
MMYNASIATLALPSIHARDNNTRNQRGCTGLAWCIVLLLSLARIEEAWADWVEQGPGPTKDGQTEGITDNPVSGAINAIVADPKNADILYIGAVNGGVWKTTNAKSAAPDWKPLTDTRLTGLSIASLATSPVNPTVLFAGTGSTSANGGEGNPGFGIARSEDGGTTWTVLAADRFAGKRMTSLVPTTLSAGTVVLTANFYDQLGVYRSSDKGAHFERLSGKSGSGLPDAGVSSLIADPGNPKRFYAAVPARLPSLTGNKARLNTNAPGIYRSDDGGLTWRWMKTNPIARDKLSMRILLSAHDALGSTVLYAAVGNWVKKKDVWRSVYKSTTAGEDWMKLPPLPNISPGEQASIHGALVTDPINPNIVYISGDVQIAPKNKGPISTKNPNALGCTNWTGNVYRYDGQQWESLVCNGANHSAPHADSRFMVFDADKNLLQANDGGIYRLENPKDITKRRWVSVLGNLRLAEFISAAYDPVNGMVFGGMQDNGTSTQRSPNDFAWDALNQGDGGVVAVGAIRVAQPKQSIRYFTNQKLEDLSRSIWDTQGKKMQDPEPVALQVKGKGKPLSEVDTVQFYNRYVLNALDPSRMLIGTENIYASMNQGDLLQTIYHSPDNVNRYFKALAYGGRSNNTSFFDVLYAGTSNMPDPEPESDNSQTEAGQPNATGVMANRSMNAPFKAARKSSGLILHRLNIGDKVKPLKTYPGSGVVDLAMDPNEYKNIFVVDDQKRIWASFDEGSNWTEITHNVSEILNGDITTLAVKSNGSSDLDLVLIAGGGYGVVQLRNPAANSTWTTVDNGLPKVLVTDLHYDATDNVLVAGTLGRGIWTVSLE